MLTVCAMLSVPPPFTQPPPGKKRDRQARLRQGKGWEGKGMGGSFCVARVKRVGLVFYGFGVYCYVFLEAREFGIKGRVSGLLFKFKLN